MMRQQPQAWGLARGGLRVHLWTGPPSAGQHTATSPQEPGPWEGRKPGHGLAQAQPSDLRGAVLWNRGCR